MKCIKLDQSSIDNILENLLKRSPNQYDSYQDTVAAILNDVKEKGDQALFEYTKKFDQAEITKETIGLMADEDSELISVYYGEDITEEDAQALGDELQELYPDCEVEVYEGGQPIYYYVVSVE